MERDEEAEAAARLPFILTSSMVGMRALVLLLLELPTAEAFFLVTTVLFDLVRGLTSIFPLDEGAILGHLLARQQGSTTLPMSKPGFKVITAVAECLRWEERWRYHCRKQMARRSRTCI